MAVMREKSRREIRKEARLEKKKKKSDSWILNQQRRGEKNKQEKKRRKKKNWKKKVNFPNKSPNVHPQCSEDDQISPNNLVSERLHSSELPITDKPQLKIESSKSTSSSALKGKGLSKGDKYSKTKFEEFLEMDMQQGDISRQEDLELERKLAKKLKVKDGKLGGVDDDINFLIEGTSSEMDFEEVHENKSEVGSLLKKCKKRKLKEKESEGVGEKIEIRKKTKFEKYLEMQDRVPSAEADLYMEKKLAKKLKVKKGKLKGGDDGIDELVDGIPSILDLSDSEEDLDGTGIKKSVKDKSSSKKSKKTTKASEQDGEAGLANDMSPEKITAQASKMEESLKYVAPHLRSRVRTESEECAQIRRRIRGLLNRLSESNVESITGEMSTIFRSMPRATSSQIMIEETLGSISGGPRGNEQFSGLLVNASRTENPYFLEQKYAATFASFVAGMAGSVGTDFGAKLLESLAKCFEEESLKEDNLSLRNLTLLLSYLYIFGVCSSDLIYDFMNVLSKRLMETEVATIVAVLQCCGMNLRSDDPVAMKDFVLNVQNRANELKSSTENGQPNKNSKRMEFMLETICEIKNNKRRAKDETPQHTRIKKWLQKLKAEDILVRGLKWSKLLDPNKKGQWWLSGELASSASHVEQVSRTIDMKSLEAQKLLQLASAQRMNTDIRRAIFCIIMSGEDYVDAFEKLLRLDLQGKQDREVMRVLLDCCLQEKVFNKYYTVLATKLCKHDNNYVTTLKYCIWDQFKELDSMELLRSRNLSKFIVEMVASFTLSLSVLKKVDFSDSRQLTGKVTMHFRMVFETLFERPDTVVWNVFTRIAAEMELDPLRSGIEFFIKSYVVSSDNSLAKKFRIAKKALANAEGVLM